MRDISDYEAMLALLKVCSPNMEALAFSVQGSTRGAQGHFS